jgi:hypothetical protein
MMAVWVGIKLCQRPVYDSAQWSGNIRPPPHEDSLGGGAYMARLQGYLAHKKTPPQKEHHKALGKGLLYM